MTKRILALSAVVLASCATNPRIQSIYDTRTTNPEDKELVQSYAKDYITQISAAGAISLGAAHSAKALDTVQKLYCACQKKLADKCSSPGANITAEEKDLWAKGNAAEVALIATGNPQQADKHLCE